MPSLTSVAESILAEAKQIDRYLESNGIPFPSYEKDTLEQLPPEIEQIRISLVNRSNELKQLSRGAIMTTMDISLNWTDTLPLRIIYHYNLAKAIPLSGTASYAEIAASSGLREGLCFRVIRAAMSINIFEEDTDRTRVKHTAISRALATNQGLRDAVGFELEDSLPASTKLIEVWKTYGQNAGEPTQSAFGLYNGTVGATKPIFEVFAAEPERGRRFGSAMAFFTSDGTWDLRHILTAFDWSTLDIPGAHVIDIGGGNGQVSKYLAKHTQYIKFTVQDLPHVIEPAIAELSKDLEDRIDFDVHDFLRLQKSDRVPSAFLLRFILHDWSDKYAIQILQGLIPALRKGSKILIYEYVLADEPVKDITGRFGFQMDLIMATLFNGQERNKREYEKLLQTSDERFVLERVLKPEGSTMSLIEVTWTG
ncbi:MAG: hypothetical protein M1820_002310 [Bogoriella megaspora]|nr:MAG: hypothetical protein M1820_002310 [Bogoriella megaspora]